MKSFFKDSNSLEHRKLKKKRNTHTHKEPPQKAYGQVVTDLPEPRNLKRKSAAGKANKPPHLYCNQKAQDCDTSHLWKQSKWG